MEPLINLMTKLIRVNETYSTEDTQYNTFIILPTLNLAGLCAGLLGLCREGADAPSPWVVLVICNGELLIKAVTSAAGCRRCNSIGRHIFHSKHCQDPARSEQLRAAITVEMARGNILISCDNYCVA